MVGLRLSSRRGQPGLARLYVAAAAAAAVAAIATAASAASTATLSHAAGRPAAAHAAVPLSRRGPPARVRERASAPRPVPAPELWRAAARPGARCGLGVAVYKLGFLDVSLSVIQNTVKIENFFIDPTRLF